MDTENVAYAYTGMLFSLKKEGNSSLCKTWMNLEDITSMLSKISQSKKDKYSMIPLVLDI